MKKIFISGLMTILTLGLFSQIAFYDAVELSKYIDRKASPPVFKNDNASITAVSEILLKYCPNLPPTVDYHNVISSITTNVSANKNYNPILAPYLNITIPEGGANVSVKSMISSVGNLNVTDFADGLAKFLVERSKEELNVAFFRKFQEFFIDYPEVKIIFPTTYQFLEEIYSYQYAAMLPALKAAFQRDLNAFSTNLLDLREGSNYEGYDTNEKVRARADAIINFLMTPEGRSVTGAVIIANGIVKGNNAADIISNLAEDKICTAFPKDNFSNTIRFIDLISYSLRSKDEGRVWITKQQVNALANDDIAIKIYLGLIYAVDQHSSHPIQFTPGGSPVALKDFLVGACTEFSTEAGLKFRQSYSEMADNMSEVSDNARNIIEARQQGDNSSILVYAEYASSISVLLKQAVNFLPGNSGISPVLARLSPELAKFTSIIDEATGTCYDLKSQNYGALVLHTSALLAELLGPEYTFRDDFIKYGTFMANIVEANNSDEVNAAIEAAVLPVGSSSIKRETDFNLSLNAFIGPFGGAEYMPTLKIDQWAFTTGITAPVGVAVSWGNLGKGKTRNSGKISGGKSLTLFVPVIDIGSMASFRMGNDSTDVASEVKLANIISPGLYLYYGFGKCPVSIGLGGQLGPQLRNVNATDVNIDKNYYFRFGLNVVVDIPFFNLYTKN
jgi:hypothetical protein